MVVLILVLRERGAVYVPTLAAIAAHLRSPWPSVVGAVLPWSVLRSASRFSPVLRSPLRGSLALSPGPAWSVMPYAAPLRSTPSASRRETRRHFVPSRSLLGRSRRSAPLRARCPFGKRV